MGVVDDFLQGVAEAVQIGRVAKWEQIEAFRIRAFPFPQCVEEPVLYADHVMVFGFHAVHGDKRMLAGVFSVTIEIFFYIMLLGK